MVSTNNVPKLFRSKRSIQFRNWIDFAVIIMLVFIGIAIYTMITRYFKWKSEQVQDELRQIEGFVQEEKTNIGIVSMIKQPKNLDTWLQKHRAIGIRHFYIRLEDTPELLDFLHDQSDVTLHVGKGTGVNEYTEIQKRQNVWVDDALKLAENDNIGVEWLIHIDGDELLEGDLHQIQDFPDSVRTFWMQNVEARYERVPEKEDNCFSAKCFINCAEHPDKCVSYGNGKGGGRVATDVSANGPHRFKSSKSDSDENIDGIVVQHYESCDFEQYKQKFQRLSVQDNKKGGGDETPFSYYNESIAAAKKGVHELKEIYTKYRIGCPEN